MDETPRLLSLSHLERINNGLSYSDTERMQLRRRTVAGGRALPPPEFVFNQRKLRALLVHAVERRAGFLERQPGSEQQRLERAQARLLAKRAWMSAALDRLCREYSELRRSPRLGDDERLRLHRLEVEIENLDTQLVIAERVTKVLVAVIYFYWNLGLNCCDVAKRLRLKPPHVRKLLWQLRHTWALINRPAAGRPAIPHRPRRRRAGRPRSSRRSFTATTD